MIPEAFIFDMDGLMFDTERLSTQAWKDAGKQMGYPIDEEVISQIRGTTPKASIGVFRENYGPSFDYPTARALRNQYLEQSVRLHGLPVKPGLSELLITLSEHSIPAAVASSSPLKTIRWYLSLADMERFFQVIISGEEAAREAHPSWEPRAGLRSPARAEAAAGRGFDRAELENGILWSVVLGEPRGLKIRYQRSGPRS